MGDDDSLSHHLAVKLQLEENAADDALKEQRRQRASGEVFAGRLAPEERAALPLSTSTHTDRRRDLYQDTLGPSVVDQPSQETAAEKDPVVDAAGDAPKPSPSTVTEDDDLYRDDGVTIHRRPMASPAPAVAAAPASAPDADDDKKLSHDDKAISQWQRTLKTSSRGKRPSKLLMGEAYHVAAEARRRDPLSSLPVETNDRRRTVCGLTQVLGAPARRSQPVGIHEDNDEEDLISFENTVTFRPGTQPDDSSTRPMASDSRLSGTSSLQAQQSRPLGPQPSLPANSMRSASSGLLSSASSSIRPQPSLPVNSLCSDSAGLLNSGLSSTRPQTSRHETAPFHSRPSAFLRSGTSSRHTQSFCPGISPRRPETFSIHSETSSTYSQPSRPDSSCTEISARSSGTVVRPETSCRRRRPQPSSSRFWGLFANPRPEDNVRPRGASAETDPDKENVYCHACGKDVEGFVVLCPCGHYYCPQCLGRIYEAVCPCGTTTTTSVAPWRPSGPGPRPALSSSGCPHFEWDTRNGAGTCNRCGVYLGRFQMVCRGCGVHVCMDCRNFMRG
ncbi:hypothetical protein Neosp_014028 [[Neocosmospora] mangrovei]